MSTARTAGPVGRVLRLLMGTALTILAARQMISGNTTLNLQAAGILLGLLLFYAMVHWAIARLVPSINPWLGAVIAITPVFLVFALVGPALRFAPLLFIGVSLVVTAIRSDGGCEVMTLPGMLMGKRTHLVCLVFSPLDWIEDKLTGGVSNPKDEISRRGDERA